MYISSTNADIRKAAPYDIKKTNIKKFLKYPYRANSKLPCNIVGGNITISNNSSENNNSAKTGRKLTNRFMVRGHYHHFWMNRTEKITDNMVVKTNENGKVLVRKWIEPFWKGSEYADVILKNYKVTI
jgi:UDP-2,3-diacylglucosamine pyrophosphatase LpxH